MQILGNNIPYPIVNGQYDLVDDGNDSGPLIYK